MTTFHLSDGDATVCDDGLHDVFYDGVPSPTGQATASYTLLRKLHMSRYSFATKRRRHALDASEHEELLGYIEKARNHVSDVVNGSGVLDEQRLRGYLDSAYDCLGVKAEDDELADRAAQGGGTTGYPSNDRSRARDSLPRGLRAPVDLGALFDVPNAGGGR